MNTKMTDELQIIEQNKTLLLCICEFLQFLYNKSSLHVAIVIILLRLQVETNIYVLVFP
jgi:hypothetical protein